MLLPSVRFCKGKNVCHRWILMNWSWESPKL
jgi:hypothetical protein